MSGHIQSHALPGLPHGLLGVLSAGMARCLATDRDAGQIRARFHIESHAVRALGLVRWRCRQWACAGRPG